MAKPVPVRTVLGQQPGRQRRLHRLEHLVFTVAGNLGQQGVRHHPASHRGGRHQLPGRARQRGHPLPYHLRHRPRNRQRSSAQATAVVDLIGVADQEERHATCAPYDRRHHPRRLLPGRGRGQRGQQPSGLRIGQRAQRQHPHQASPGQVGDQLGQPGTGRGLRVPVGADDPQRRGPRHRGQQRGQQVHCVRASPLQIIKDQQGAGLASHRVQQPPSRGRQQPPLPSRLCLRRCRAPGPAGRGQLGQQEVYPAGLPHRRGALPGRQPRQRIGQRFRQRGVGIVGPP